MVVLHVAEIMAHDGCDPKTWTLTDKWEDTKTLRLLVLVPRSLRSQCLCLRYPPIHPISFYSVLPVFHKGRCCRCIYFSEEAGPVPVGALAQTGSSSISYPITRAQWQVTRLHHDPRCGWRPGWSSPLPRFDFWVCGAWSQERQSLFLLEGLKASKRGV